MNIQQKDAIGTVNAYSMYVSGFVNGAADTEFTEEKLNHLERSCSQLEAACNDLAESING